MAKLTQQKVFIDRTPTGVPGLDQILSGGLPKNQIYLVQGDPGAGKTTFALQFLLEGLRANQPALYVTFSESRRELEEVAASHDWDIAKMAMFDLSATESLFRLEAQNTVFHSSEIELTETTQALLRVIEESNPVRLAIDSVSELRLLAGSDLRFRRQLLFLKTYFSQRGMTVLLVDDLADQERSHTLQSLSHGVFGLERLTPEFGANRRRLSVLKLRGSSFIEGYHDYVIRTGGIVIFPRVSASSERKKVEPRRLSSGLPPLDTMLKGGLDAGTSALLIGPAGCGKSTLAMQFAYAAAQRGERACIFLFDENLHSYHLRARSMNLTLDEGIVAERVNVYQIDPAEMSSGEFAHMVYGQVEAGASMVVIDSLNGYLQASPGERYVTLHLHELLSFLSQRGVLTLAVLAQHGMVGSMASQIDITYLADNVLLLRYFEWSGSIHKALSVFKRRGGPHENTIRELKLSAEGVEIGEPLTHLRGIMSGIPEPLGGPGQASKSS